MDQIFGAVKILLHYIKTIPTYDFFVELTAQKAMSLVK